MKRFGLFIIALYFATSMGCIIIHDDQLSSITIVNDSDYDIYEIYIAPSDSSHWGPNILGHDTLYSGDSMIIDYLECDYYDVEVVDEYGYSCQLIDEYLCFDDAVWRITNYTLDVCYE